jgi:hypothetical protein
VDRAEKAEIEKVAVEMKMNEEIERFNRVSQSFETMLYEISAGVAKKDFPEEIWTIDDGVRIANTRILESKKSKNALEVFEKEKNMAKTLSADGYSVFLVPENKRNSKNPDAIVNGIYYDFKATKFKQVERRFLDALQQADNAVLKLDGDDFTLPRIYGKLRSHVKGKDGKLILILNGKIYTSNFKDM